MLSVNIEVMKPKKAIDERLQVTRSFAEALA